MEPRWAIHALLCIGASALAAAALPGEGAVLPPPAPGQVDFKSDIQPILEASCVKCHGRGKTKGGFQLDTRETFLKEADSGPTVVPGRSADSRLIHLVSGLDPDNVMPQKGTRLTHGQIGLLRAWIDQGLTWDPAVTFAREPHRNLEPRRIEPPPGTAMNPVDRFVETYFRQQGKTSPAPVNDRLFARRVTLDVIGLLPTPDELAAFERDSREDKRALLVRRLLADRHRYAQHWLTFWNDLLRNDYRGTGYIDGGREPISPWLYAALRDNKPYDQFVRELVNPGEDGPGGFSKGIVWRGVVNASQRPPIQAAQNISQVFLGVNLKCASCHDSFIDDWQLSDAYGMAGIYSEEPLELVQCDKPLGTHVSVSFLFPEIGTVEDRAPRAERIAQLARLVTTRANGRFPRTIVNRLWAQLMGRGLVEPLDVMQNQAWHPDLLDWLAEDFVESGYDLKHTLELVLTSRAYQMPSVDLPEEAQEDYVFAGPGVRRLSAEQFRDALGQLTGVWHDSLEGGLESVMFDQGKPDPLPTDAFWIWSDPHADQSVPPRTIYLRRAVELPTLPEEALAFVHADNSHRLWVNGQEIRKKKDIPWNETSLLDLRRFLSSGRNVFAVEATNAGESPNPAGFLFYARLRPGSNQGTDRVWDVASDGSWRASTNRMEGWERSGFDDANWPAAAVLGPPDTAPWRVGARFAATVAGEAAFGSIRASLVAADPLARALGRPNREQVTSSRLSTATAIQALELTNGETLAEVLRHGSEKLLDATQDGPALIRRVFEQGLGRRPTQAEGELALQTVGAQPRADAVEDLLWAITMLPEFQLIY